MTDGDARGKMGKASSKSTEKQIQRSSFPLSTRRTRGRFLATPPSALPRIFIRIPNTLSAMCRPHILRYTCKALIVRSLNYRDLTQWISRERASGSLNFWRLTSGNVVSVNGRESRNKGKIVRKLIQMRKKRSRVWSGDYLREIIKKKLMKNYVIAWDQVI